CQQGTDWSLTF
nr:immunoglobulin light chain junction region [Macaca mulatta]